LILDSIPQPGHTAVSPLNRPDGIIVWQKLQGKAPFMETNLRRRFSN
jgi:hypothetical protein